MDKFVIQNQTLCVVLGVIFFSAGWYFYPFLPGATLEPDIRVESVDLGTLAEGELADFEVVVHNDSSDEVRLRGVSMCCSARVDSYPHSIDRRAKGAIRGQVRSFTDSKFASGRDCIFRSWQQIDVARFYRAIKNQQRRICKVKMGCNLHPKVFSFSLNITLFRERCLLNIACCRKLK